MPSDQPPHEGLLRNLRGRLESPGRIGTEVVESPLLQARDEIKTTPSRTLLRNRVDSQVHMYNLHGTAQALFQQRLGFVQAPCTATYALVPRTPAHPSGGRALGTLSAMRGALTATEFGGPFALLEKLAHRSRSMSISNSKKG